MGRIIRIGSLLLVVIFLGNGFFTGEFLMLMMLAGMPTVLNSNVKLFDLSIYVLYEEAK
jgi:hypothetical protein